MPAFLHLVKPTTSGSLGIKCFQSSLDISGELYISFSCISSPGSVQVCGRVCHSSIHTTNSSGTILDGGSSAFHSSQHVRRHSSSVSYHKRSHQGCLSRVMAQGFARIAFNPLAAQRYVVQTRVLLFCQSDSFGVT